MPTGEPVGYDAQAARSLRAEFESNRRTREAEESAARLLPGMSFWRLVWIVALGVLLAQVIAGAAVWILSTLQQPGILR